VVPRQPPYRKQCRIAPGCHNPIYLVMVSVLTTEVLATANHTSNLSTIVGTNKVVQIMAMTLIATASTSSVSNEEGHVIVSSCCGFCHYGIFGLEDSSESHVISDSACT